ncbi:HU domain-containing protein [Solitalea canadensis]|uniref:CCDC81-like prokaryotic HU domain-containing protein n=1 Tax=Solitalea canadensis (strain ATCC 29591 / DSM 3403 / JCM 21819 / LMG 8368 / NBRC 15130 / NCIMB 12057 / USAM 9D) TaxID=929556 RepID=H8KY60_SOLCM|nr:hypothetical protein [Solitalea canadensis]AFD05798.1 hypothetical protein Solca_0673 [Solitalea canadensis DSM 3403]
MTEITKHIITLLERNNEVTIPSVGGLYLSKTETKYHYDNTTFYPSNVSVTFNPHRLSDDGLLRNEIALGENLSTHMAEYELQKFIIKVKQELSRNHEFDLPGIGKLVSDQMANITFKTIDGFVLNKDNYGLSEITSRPVDPHKGSLATERRISSAAPVEKQERNVWKWLLISLGIIIILSLILLLGVQYYLQNVQ